MSGGINPADDFANLTLDEYIEEKTRDQFFNDFTLLGIIEKKVGASRMHGGDNIVEILNITNNTRGGSYAGFDTFVQQPIETLKSAYYRHRKYQWSVTAGADEVLRNRGSQRQILDLWMTKADVALKSMRNRLNTDAYLDGTGNAGKNMEGLALLVDNAATYGQISRSTYSVWQSKVTAVGGALSILGPTGMLKMWHDTSLGSDTESEVDVLLGTQTAVEEYEGLLLPDVRYQGVNGAGDGSFSSINFKGRPFAWDKAAPSGKLFFLAADTFRFVVHPERDFVTTPIRDPMKGTSDQDAWSADILAWVNLLNVEPRRNGVLTGIV